MKPALDPNKVVVITGAGAGVSAESGVPTFRDSNGLLVKRYGIAG